MPTHPHSPYHNHTLTDGVEFDTPYGVLQETWDHQITSLEIETIIRQVQVSQKPLNHPYTFLLWHKPEDSALIVNSLKNTNHQEMTHIFWHKTEHTAATQANDYVRAVEMATIGFFPNRGTCFVNHPIAPPERHNFIELPHETHFAKDPQGNKINPAQKPEALAQHFCQHHIPVGGTILIIGAGAGGSVFGALRSGVNVVAVENDNFQFEMFKRTFLAKQQAEFDKIDGKSDEEEEEVPATQPLSQEKSSQPAPNPASGLPSPPAQSCDCCGEDLTTDDIATNASCVECTGIQGYLCGKCTFPHPDIDSMWLCKTHHNQRNQESQAF